MIFFPQKSWIFTLFAICVCVCVCLCVCALSVTGAQSLAPERTCAPKKQTGTPNRYPCDTAGFLSYSEVKPAPLFEEDGGGGSGKGAGRAPRAALEERSRVDLPMTVG
jgi:hypothetical protein